jgi:hypothetical protein
MALLAGANGGSFIRQVVHAKEQLNASSEMILPQTQQMAPMRPFWVAHAGIRSAASARFGYALKDPADNDIITQL